MQKEIPLSVEHLVAEWSTLSGIFLLNFFAVFFLMSIFCTVHFYNSFGALRVQRGIKMAELS